LPVTLVLSTGYSKYIRIIQRRVL